MTPRRSASPWPDLDRAIHASPVVVVRAPGYPPPGHPAEEGLFDRQMRMPGHNQVRLQQSHVLVIGCGGLGSWSAMMLGRMGIGRLTLADGDRYTQSNLHRQLAGPDDVGLPKAHALARTVSMHMLTAGDLTGIAMPWPDAAAHVTVDIDGVLVGVDNNRARLEAAGYARQAGIPAVFVMLSADGMRVQVVLQRADGPCLSCLLPNIDADRGMPCTAAYGPSCITASGHAVHALASELMTRTGTPTWRETSLDGSTERTGSPPPRPACTHGASERGA